MGRLWIWHKGEHPCRRARPISNGQRGGEQPCSPHRDLIEVREVLQVDLPRAQDGVMFLEPG